MEAPRPLPLEEMPLEAIKGIGPKLAKTMNGMDLATVADLFAHYPHRYIDLSTVKKIGQVAEGEEITIVGRVKQIEKRAGRRGKLDILTITVFDGTGYLSAVWFNQSYIADRLRQDDILTLSGRVTWRYGRLQIQSPFYDIVESGGAAGGFNAGRILAVHPATAKLSASRFRKLIRVALDEFSDQIPETLPAHIRERYGLMETAEATRQVHFPESTELLQAARKTLIFDELFFLQLGLALKRKWVSSEAKGIRHKVSGGLLD